MRTRGTPVERQVHQPVAGLHGPGPLRREMGAGVAQLEGADPCRIESLAEIASMGHVTGPGSHADDCRNAPRARETVVIKMIKFESTRLSWVSQSRMRVYLHRILRALVLLVRVLVCRNRTTSS
jgi:hypothetical protein